MTRTLCIITPMYNEQGNVWRCVRAVQDDAARSLLGQGWDVVHAIVDDGSTDGTTGVLDRLKDDVRAGGWNLRVFHHATNYGANIAVWTALENVDADAYVLHLPADLQDPPGVIPEMMKVFDGGKFLAVYGQRKGREGVESKAMVLARDLYYRIITLFSGGPVIPHAGTFVVVDRGVVNDMRAWHAYHPCVFPYLSTFILRLIKDSMWAVPFEWQPRRVGKSHYSVWKLIGETLKAIRWCRDWPLPMTRRDVVAWEV